MAYEVLLDPQVVSYLKDLMPDLQERIKKKLFLLKENPFNYLEHFEGDYYKLRIGDYRALIDVDFENKIVIIRVLDHRNRVYK
ncbi:MAG: type II toxin-antitoxin system RelE/ParE family toxin [Candidatus Micrarchaeota archaeon]